MRTASPCPCADHGPDTDTADAFLPSSAWSTEAVFQGSNGEKDLADLGADCVRYDAEGNSFALPTSTLTPPPTPTPTPTTSVGPASDLFISEYVEGSSNNKVLEIANFTGHAIDLVDYRISKILNGGAWGEETIALSGTLADGAVWVVCHPQSSPAILATCDLQTASVNWNGNDAVGLAKKGPLIDAIGTATSSGAEWTVANVTAATRDHVLRRAKTVCGPSTDWVKSALTAWIVGAKDDASDLGKHTFTP